MRSLLKYFRQTFVVSMLCFFSGISAESVVIEDSEGNAFLFDIHPENSFLDVINSLSEDMVSVHDEQEFKVFKILVAKQKKTSEPIAKKKRSTPRNFADGIFADEAKDIVYILKTMANNSVPWIMGAESSLKRAGKRIEDVHPFFFLSCIFTNEELKVCIRNLQGKIFVWDGFLDGIVGSLGEESKRKNLLQYVDDFAAIIKVDPNVIRKLIEDGEWEKFIDKLIEIVPREGEVKRYNM